MRPLSSIVLSFGFFTLALIGCGGGGAASVEVGITAQALESTAPPQGGSDTTAQRHLVLTVNEASVHVAANAAGAEDEHGEAPGEVEGESGWITVFSGETKLDLLDATSTEALLGSIEVPAGKITQVRLVLAGAELVDGDTTSAVTCPSCSQSGLKIITQGKLEVAAGDTLHLALDFDQTRSLTQSATGYRLDPVIKIAGVEEN